MFVRDLRTGKTRRLSTAWNGKEADDYSCGPTVADNGDTTFESEANNLVRDDPDGKEGHVPSTTGAAGASTASASWTTM